MPKKTRIVMSRAWIVTWEWMGDHAKVPDDKKLVTIVSSRWSGERVRQLIKRHYVALQYPPGDKLGVAANPKGNPCPAEFGHLGRIPWTGEIRCGHNPFLYARYVKNFRYGDKIFAEVTCEEEPRPKPPAFLESLPE